MSTYVHTPSHSPSGSDFFAFRHRPQNMHDSHFVAGHSPCRQFSATPPRKQPYLLLTPSPLRRRTDCNLDFDSAMQLDFDDFSSAAGFSTPFHSKPNRVSSPKNRHRPRPLLDQPMSKRNQNILPEDDEGLFLRSSTGHTSLPLWSPDRLLFDHVEGPKTISKINFSHAPKRKINHVSSSPSSKRGLTPIHIHPANDEENGTLKRFATLAPLPAPKFLRKRGSAGSNIGGQVDTLSQMQLSDRPIECDTDSGSESEFSIVKVRRTSKQDRPSTAAQEAAASLPLDGHINKRRTRTRPASLEFISAPSPIKSPRKRATSKVRASHRRSGSTILTSETGSSMLTAKLPERTRIGLDRVASSATLFFGPKIGSPAGKSRSKLSQPDDPVPPSTPVKADDDVFGLLSPDDSFTNAFSKAPGETSFFPINVISGSPSPRRIPTKFKQTKDPGVVPSDDEMDECIQPVLDNLAKPDSLPRLQTGASTLPQPSGGYSTSTSSEETLLDDGVLTPSHEQSRDMSWLDCSAETSVVDDFIVKTLEAGTKDSSICVEKRPPGTPQKRNKTAFLKVDPIQRPWASAFTDKLDRTPLFGEKLTSPNFETITNSGGSSAGDLSIPRNMKSSGKPRKSCPGNLKVPNTDGRRVSGLTRMLSSGSTASDVDVSPCDSPLHPFRNRTYGDMGIGRPNAIKASQHLSRRSSSGTFSTTSDASDATTMGTPTRRRDSQFLVPMLPLRPQTKFPGKSHPSQTPARNQTPHPIKRVSISRRPASPYTHPAHPDYPKGAHGTRFGTPGVSKSKHQPEPRKSSVKKQPRPFESPGRFDRDFVEVDKIGAGEFGSAMKVRYKNDTDEDRVFAVKISKRFEGNRHRSRLREEVEVLQHLAASSGPTFHPNILGYVDSWEQDDQLYILTELCEFGNFERFLSEFGHHFARLEEARVWKIFADICSGLRFMHSNNVVHFDLKPANVFITSAGRFKIGDFGMASIWPRPPKDLDGSVDFSSRLHGFEREGDKMYLAAEVLQGRYGKETDIFSFGMMMLETATNIVVPAQGDLWHKLREEDFSPVDGLNECSTTLVQLIASMMRKDPSARPSAEEIHSHAVITRARTRMETVLNELRDQGETRTEMLFKCSPLAGVDEAFLSEILGPEANTNVEEMDLSN